MRIFFLYRLLQLFAIPFLIVHFAFRLLTDRAYRPHFTERLGFLPRSFFRTAPGAIWFHAVSAGEVATAVPLIKTLKEQEPRISIFISTSTAAGRSTATRRLAGVVEGVFYAPLDYASCVRRTLHRIKPSLVVVLETEIWPNLYSQVKRVQASLVIVNGRISSRSWPHYRGAKWFFAPVLRLPDLVFPQSATDRDRYYRLGVPVSKLLREGNLKYDACAAAAPTELPTFGGEPVWIAASTVAPGESHHYKHDVDEDDIVLDIFEKLAPSFGRLLLIIAPRQPARFDVVAEKLKARGISFVRRTELTGSKEQTPRLPGVILLDTIGELAGTFPLADVVFVGGSLAPRGGHNVLEPAAAGRAVITGLHMENFESIASDLVESGAMLQVKEPEELAQTLDRLFRNRDEARALGRKAQLLLSHKQGASQRIAGHLWPLYWSAAPARPHGLVSRVVLGALSQLWLLGGRIKGQQDEAKHERLPVPVISVGGITVGGAGKTPFTKYLAKKLSDRGRSPAILMRGYGRRTPARNIILPKGASAPPALTGDEAQIYLREGVCPVGIGANRVETGRLLLQHMNPDLFLLDDGFQHRRIYRHLDIVVIDGLMPFGQRHTVPLGRLREPLEALDRADAFVVTRADNDLRLELISKELREYNSRAPIFRIFTRPRQWRICMERETVEHLPWERVAAFCGLGNPQNFWNTLTAMGLDIAYQQAFPDHHAYQPIELRRLAFQARRAGADGIVTTEKDRINFPREFAESLGSMDVAWLEIESSLEHEDEFFDWLESRIGQSRTNVT